MEVTTVLSDSFLCRLCAEENRNGTNIFDFEETRQELCELINKYLPLKVENDGKYPGTICPGCNIQLEATMLFFDLVITGQNKLRQLYNNQQETLKRQEKQRQQLENALKNVNPSSSVETYTIQTDESGEKFVIQILSDGPLFPSEHELSLKMEGLEKPKRKRGRPPKPQQIEEQPQSQQQPDRTEDNAKTKSDEQEADEEVELDSDGRRRRKRKVPTRFQEVLQGKELDRIFKEEGVIDEDSLSEDEQNLEEIIQKDDVDEIIGHMQSKDGEDLGQLVLINKGANKTRFKHRNPTTGIKKKKRYDCDICGRVFLHLGRLEIHKTFHKNIKYHCSEDNCLKETDSKFEIEDHQKESGHSGVTIIESLENYGHVQVPQVDTCNEKENDADIDNQQKKIMIIPEKEPQQKSETTTSRFNCTICNKSFSCKQNFETHNKAVHENQKPYQCTKCDKNFAYLNTLKCHMLQHTDKIYPCEVCDKVFNHPSSLVYHREAEHNNGRKFVCNKCKKTFKHKQLLLRHQLVHSNERPYMCKYCEASFKTRANLLNHMPMHTGEKKYYCNQCGQTFAHKTSLTVHLRWHNGQKPYQCDVCSKTFSQKGNLAEHRRIHTGEKPYCCDLCGRKFTTSSQFKLHVKRHTGERPWQCEYCSKTFLHKDTWKCHTRRHRNERPYQCQQCLRGFTEQWALKKHERLHTGEKPHVCDVCNKSFADSSNLSKHKKIHTNAKAKAKSVVNKANDKIRILTTEGEDHILCFTYQDGSNDDQSPTLVQVMNNLVNKDDLDTTTTILRADDEIDFENSLQIQQIVDNDGNPINLTTADGQQIKVVTNTEEGQETISGLLPDGTLVPINLNLQDLKGLSNDLLAKSKNETLEETSKDDEEEEKEENILTSVDSLLQNDIQFLTEDGQNVCFVTTYNVDDAINPHQFLAMT